MSQPHTEPADLKARLATELRSYSLVSFYLFICFGVISIYNTSITAVDSTLGMLSLGVVLGKALVVGKFILIGEAFDTGTRINAPTLLHRIGVRSVSMLLVLIVLKFIEELVLGLIHGQTLDQLFDTLGAASWLRLLAPVLLMLLVIIPMITVIEVRHALGEQRFTELLHGKPG